jgi:ferric enterobactin receptor
MSLNKDILKDKLSVSATSDTPFNRYRIFGNNISGNNFTQTMRARYYYQSYSVSLNYKFGKLKDGLKKSKRGISNDDVIGG